MKIILVVVLLIVAFFLFVKYLEATSIFYPSRQITMTPKDAGWEYEDVRFQAADGVRLNGWLIKTPGARRNLILCHGNAGNIGDRLQKSGFFKLLGCNVLLFDFRGYGQSAGKPSEAGVYKDAVAAFDWLVARPDIGKFPIVVYGESLGGAVAVDLATKRKPAALIIESTFSSVKDMARIYYPFVPSFMVSTGFDSAEKIRRVTIPKLIIHSRNDETVPFRLAEKVFASAPEPKEFLIVTGGHNDNFFQSEALIQDAMKKFLEKNKI